MNHSVCVISTYLNTSNTDRIVTHEIESTGGHNTGNAGLRLAWGDLDQYWPLPGIYRSVSISANHVGCVYSVWGGQSNSLMTCHLYIPVTVCESSPGTRTRNNGHLSVILKVERIYLTKLGSSEVRVRYTMYLHLPSLRGGHKYLYISIGFPGLLLSSHIHVQVDIMKRTEHKPWQI